MSDPIPESLREQVIRVLEGTATASEREEVEQWRIERPEHDLHLKEVAALWETSTEVINVRSGTIPPTGADILRDRSRTRRKRKWMAARWVAAACVILVAGSLLLVGSEDPASEPYLVALDEPLTGTLPDGSVVRLSPGSRLEASFSSAERTVRLDGRAFFSVSRSTEPPFVVRTSSGDIAVIGTRFEVVAEGAVVEAAVLQGAVQLSSRIGSARIDAGYVGTSRPEGPVEVRPDDDVAGRLGWMGRFIAFEDTQLHRAAAEIEQRYGLRIEIVDGELSERRVTAWFEDEPAEDVMEILCRITHAECTYDEHSVRMAVPNETSATRSGS